MTNARVYFMIAEKAGRIKVGLSRDVPRRLAQMNAHSPELIRVHGVIECGSLREARQLEAWLHREFQEHRAHGEWFDLAPQIRMGINRRKPVMISETTGTPLGCKTGGVVSPNL